jgi:hypothetical protein
MNRAYAFAVGVLVAGVGATLFAGNPSPPAGPIEPTMVSLSELAEKIDQQQAATQSREWKASAFGGGGFHAALVGRALVHKVAISGVGFATFYDAASPDDQSTPIASLSVSSALPNAELELSVRVTKGLVIFNGGPNCLTTVLHAD